MPLHLIPSKLSMPFNSVILCIKILQSTSNKEFFVKNENLLVVFPEDEKQTILRVNNLVSRIINRKYYNLCNGLTNCFISGER
jgi:hypothetical protein